MTTSPQPASSAPVDESQRGTEELQIGDTVPAHDSEHDVLGYDQVEGPTAPPVRQWKPNVSSTLTQSELGAEGP